MTLYQAPFFSIIVPTRGRPDGLRRLLDSFKATTAHLDSLEIILVIDSDDRATADFVYDGFPLKCVVVQPGLKMGELNMAGYKASTGQYVMLLNDDVIVRTQAWDEKVLAAFKTYADGIVLVHVNDKIFGEKLCTFPFLSRSYCELADGICPSDYVRYRIDDHIYNVFNLLAVMGKIRIMYLPEVVFEHTNYVLNASSGAEYRPDPRIHEIDSKRFHELLPERKKLALRLMDHMDGEERRDKFRIRENLLKPIVDSVALRRPEYVRVWSDSKSVTSDNTRVTIGIVSANLKSDHARTCIDLIKKFTKNFDLVILDNNRRSPFNHPREMNKLLSICDTDFLVLMDDDVFVEPGWLDGMLRGVTPSVGVVTPLHKDRSGNISYAGVVMRPDYSGHHAHILTPPERSSRIQTLCSAILLIDMAKCGHIRFDESYSKYFLDIDYGFQVWLAGYEVLCSPYSSVTHIGGATLQQGSALSNDLFEIQRQHFVREWVETGRYQQLEQGIWSNVPEIQDLLRIPAEVDALLTQPGEDRELFRARALALFRSINNHPALAHWAAQRIRDAVGSNRPTADDPELGHLGFLLGCMPHAVCLEENFTGLNIVLYNANYFAIPQTEGVFDYERVIKGDYTRSYQAESLDVLKARFHGDVRAVSRSDSSFSNPVLVEQNDSGLNVVRFDGTYYAIPQAEGAFDVNRFTRGEYSRSYKANTLDEVKQQILADAAQAQPKIVLVEEGFESLNIVLSDDTYYAIPQGEGAFDRGRVTRNEYSRSYLAGSVEELKAQIRANWSTKIWRMLRSEKARTGSWRSAIKPVTKKLVKLTVARVVGPEAFPEMRESYVKAKADKGERGTWLPSRILGIGAAVHKGARLFCVKRLYRSVEVNDLVASAHEKTLNAARAADPHRWLNASPMTVIEPNYHGYSVYGFEYKFFALPRSAGAFNYQDFKQGKYDACLIRHSLSEVHAAVDELLHSKQATLSSRGLVFACLPRAQLKPLLERVCSDRPLTLLVDNASSKEWPDYDKIVLEQGSVTDWARSQYSKTPRPSPHRLVSEKFDRIVIPWSFPETWGDNSLEVAASKLSSSVEVLHASGEPRLYAGENFHRLIYNKAYLASMFQVVPSVEGQAVLEAGCSDGLVSDIVALCGADKVVGIDVMETVGCGFPHDHRIDYRVMDIACMDFSDQTFDLVYSIATFEHLPNPYQALLEMLRVTKLGGHAYVQAGPLYHSPFGHHMFEYFQDYPWIHLRKSKDEIIAYAKERGIDKTIGKNLGISCEQYVGGMLNRDHVNGLLLKDYRLDEFRKRADIEVLKFNISYEGRELLTREIAGEMPGLDSERLLEHGFEIGFRRIK